MAARLETNKRICDQSMKCQNNEIDYHISINTIAWFAEFKSNKSMEA